MTRATPPIPPLSPVQVRILGALLEKEATTPAYYPLTLNALVNACNQKSNRSPHMDLVEPEVEKAVEGLRSLGVVQMVSLADARVPKYRHTLDKILSLNRGELALLCELFLRGPQTPGELHSRSARLCSWTQPEEFQQALQSLSQYHSGPLISMLSRQPGQRENRYQETLSEASAQIREDDEVIQCGISEPAKTERDPSSNGEKLPESTQALQKISYAELVQKVTDLENDLNQLRSEFDSFRKLLE